MNTYLSLLRDNYDPADALSSTLNALFSVCDVLYDADPNLVPAQCEYSPALGGPEVPGTKYADGSVMALDDENLSFETAEIWQVLHQQPDAYWEDPTFEARVQELRQAALLLDRLSDILDAQGWSL